MTKPVAKPETSQAAIAQSLSVYFIWGALTLYWKELHGFDPFELIGWRITSSVLVLVAVMLATGRLVPLLRSLRNPQLLIRIALASVLLTINWATYVWAVVNDHVIETALGYFIAPILTIVVGVFVLHEKLRSIQRVAVSFAVGGIVVLTVAYGRVPWIALIIATSWTFYAYLKKKVPLQPLESLTAEVIVLAIPAFIYLCTTWSNVDSVPNTANSVEWAFVAFTGVITAVPLLMFASASQRSPLIARSRGSPSPRSPTMLRWMFEVPPAIDIDSEIMKRSIHFSRAPPMSVKSSSMISRASLEIRPASSVI